MFHEGLPRLRWLPATAALLSLVACGGEEEPTPEPQQPAACTQETYDEAVLDAAEPTQEDVIDGLWAITPSNPRLSWNEERSAVRMVAWTTWTGYEQGDNTLSQEIWVTAVPQLQELCRTLPDDAARIARINQFLGLPPATEHDNGRFFVEMWVRPGDMFRPCPDAEIDDTTCGLSFPEGVSAEHESWIANTYASRYGFWQTTRYPWTGLGYTYDWCSQDTKHVGASEFVVRSGSVVDVTALIDRDSYCAP
ncbi:hypothetical protein JQX13_10225 [Archangium violaceum]|uniref:hypothetical protein n=1 Tax=Archangium violaceum TaxID=83451 RepID=UPI00193B4398|nr:hypothetical protein [Archangium violaceum]QRK10427.1 hypothetical protein JQX13_10225 [Archangium violaceum]